MTDPNKPVPAEWQGFTDEVRQVFQQGEDALDGRRTRGLEEIIKIGQAFAALQQEAMRQSHSNDPVGRRYNETLAKLLKPARHLSKTNKTDRSHFMWCYKYQDALRDWWEELGKNQ